MPSPVDRTGSFSPGLARLEGVLEIARRWAGDRRLALLLSGSHATGEAVWVRQGRGTVSLSDLDLYAVLPDEAEKRAARERAHAARPGLRRRLTALGLAAPLEVGFYTPDDLAALPARPGTLELRRHGRVLDGDAAVLRRLPSWSAADVSREEVLLLLENRAFELLWAECPPLREEPLGVLQRRHAVLKVAVDLAGVLSLAAGEYPESAAARVAFARTLGDRAPAPEPPWDEALAWRAGEVRPLEPAPARAERLRTARAWVAVWRALMGDPGDPARPYAAVMRAARRATWRRRLRHGVSFEPRGGSGEGLARRIDLMWRGTPQHRLNASAAAHLIFEAGCAEAAERGGTEVSALVSGHEAVLRDLGFAAGSSGSPVELVRAWDRWILDGQRTEGWS